MNRQQAAAQLSLYLQEANVAGLPRDWFGVSEMKVNLPAGTSGSSISLEYEVARETEKNFDSSEEVSAMGWDKLEQTALACKKCRLCETRNKVVFGVGKREQPIIAFVGEGPGADEDRQGEPFVGKAGQLLTAAITKGLGLQRSDVYICNVVKCRPPQNRTPLPDETEACTPFLYRQLELLQPQVIVTLGQPAQLALSGITMGITKLRGQWQEWRGVPLMPTFHPAYLLRNPAAKPQFWEDLKAVMERVGLERPRKVNA